MSRSFRRRCCVGAGRVVTAKARGGRCTAAAVAAVRQAGILKKALKVGDKAVDFELTDVAGYRIKASELWAMGPLVVVFYRGGWSPECNCALERAAEGVAGDSRPRRAIGGHQSGNGRTGIGHAAAQQADISTVG